jgi:hypothetical protein
MENEIYKYSPSNCSQLLLHSFPTIVSFRSIATLVFADPDAKKHASPAVNGRRLPPSFFGLLQPPPLLRSQAARRNGFALVYLRFPLFSHRTIE